MELIKLSLTDFNTLTASNSPAPGGGSISALCGSLSSALIEMVANLTINKEKYAEFQQEMCDIIQEMEIIRLRLLNAVDEDTRAFDQYMAALQLPKGSEERKNAMEEGLKKAASVPLQVAETTCTLFPFLEKVLTHGNTNAVTDAMVATMLARTCVLGAVYNVRINLASIQDQLFVNELQNKCTELQRIAITEEIRLLRTTIISGF